MVEGVPEAKRSNPKVAAKRIVITMKKYLKESGIITEEQLEDSDLIKLFYSQVTNAQMSSGEKFVDYLYRFWDWGGKYVQGRLARKRPSGNATWRIVSPGSEYTLSLTSKTPGSAT
jgi:hypothetical protein